MALAFELALALGPGLLLTVVVAVVEFVVVVVVGGTFVGSTVLFACVFAGGVMVVWLG